MNITEGLLTLPELIISRKSSHYKKAGLNYLRLMTMHS